MLPFIATVAIPQPNIPSPIIPLRPVTITVHAALCVCGERSAQQAETILIGPPSALYLCIHVRPNAVQTAGAVAWSDEAEAVAVQAGTSTQLTATMTPKRLTSFILGIIGRRPGRLNGHDGFSRLDVASAKPHAGADNVQGGAVHAGEITR